ncbi:MAG: hypothetical protein QOI10_2583 [Solirubrobacterales bacterium]|nr:hypothetical protein [Solirubrobacterales bacterium]
MAAARVGLDPLVSSYRELGIADHEMTYVEGEAEQMPFDDDSFDVLLTLNSLDHVDDLDAAVREIGRVLRSGGTWLTIVEANAPATATEPQTIPWNFLHGLGGWRVEWSKRLALGDGHDIYGWWKHGAPWESGNGLLVARLTRL